MSKLKEEFKLVLIYLVIGLGWIYFSDKILLAFTADIDQFNQLQTYKGIFYVIVTAIIFYFLFKKYLNDLRKQHQKLEAKNKKLIESNKKIDTINQELDSSLKSLEKLNKRFVKMINLVYSLNEKSNLNEEEFLSDLLHNIIEIVPEADYGKIYLMENEHCNLIDAVGHDIDALKKIKESMYIDIKVKNRVVGRISLDIAENSEQIFNQGTTHILESFSTLASSFFAYKRFDRLQGKFTKELISSIIKILEIYDEYTKGHSENVANLSMLIAEEMGLSEETVLDTYWAGMVHDIGKLLVPVQILNKTERLEDFEYDIIKKHPVWSSRALADSETLKHISKYVLYHHERWDGYGYPEGLAAEDIPLVSQIIAVADAWDAMTSNRSYRDSLSKEAALKEIKKNKGSQFSPRAAAAFLRLIDKKELDIKKAVISKFESLESEEFKLDNSEHFESIFRMANEGMVILDKDFRIKKVNKYFLNFFGYQKSEVLGKKIAQLLVPAEKMDELDLNIKEITANNEVNLKTYRKRKDGQRIDVEIQAFPLSIGEKEVEYYIIYRDITELEAVKDKYENYKGRYESFFENDSIIMMIIDPENGKIIDANQAAVNFYGWSREKLKSMNISEINMFSETQIKEEMNSARRKNKKFFNFIHQDKAGDIKDVEVYSQPINFGDRDLLYSIIHEKNSIK